MPFDTIVVGAGTAGCVLAARLSEDPRRSVLILEAGPDYPDPAALPPEIATSREGAATTHDWGYTSEPGWLERSIPLLRGKLVGGCAAINNSVAIRGDTPRDYDAWDDLGNPGWSFADVLPFFRRLETDTDVQSKWHGVDGPLPIGRPSRDNLDATQRAFLDACASLGHRQVEDHNAPGAIGVGPFPSTGLGGIRRSTAGMYLHPARARPNLALRDRVTVDRVVCRGDRAVGVQLAESGEIVDSQQIILAAGAYGSPTILLRSGIGPVDQLRDLHIPVVADRPGVGRGLKDHPLLGLAFTLVEQPFGIPPATVLLTCRSSDGEEGLDLHVFARAHFRTAHESGFQMAVSLMKPRSSGQLRLRTADPAVRPIVDLGFFAHPDDLPRFLKGISRLRPDGYGVLRLGQRDYGFFLEFDRGTVRPAPLRAKFAAYHRYLASGRAAKDFDGPPSIVVVTAGPAAEDRVVDAVLAAEVGQPRRLPLLLTTVGLLIVAEGGPFGPIWRVPGTQGGRHRWPL